MQFLSWLNTTAFDGLPYSFVALSFVLTFKYIRFPDVTCAGTFVFGAAVAATATVHFSANPVVAAAAGIVAGGLGGLLTAFFHVILRIERLLAGILSAFVLYSVSSIILRPTLPYGESRTILSWAMEKDRTVVIGAIPWHPFTIAIFALLVLAAKVLLDGLLRSEYGLALRALEDEEAGPTVLRNLGLSPGAFRTFALVAGNGLVAFAGTLISMKEGAANINRGFDVLITGLIAFLLGVQFKEWLPELAQRLGRRAKRHWRVLIDWLSHLRITTYAMTGPILYFGLITLSYWVEIKPELTKLLLALFVAVAVGDMTNLRRWHSTNTRRRFPNLRSASLSEQAATRMLRHPPNALVVADNINFTYPGSDRPVLDGVSFGLGRGECVQVRGPNGSGKSTLLKLLAGHIDAPTAGRVLIDGKDVTFLPNLRRQVCSYIAQDPRSSVVETFSALENLALMASDARVSALRRPLSARKVTELRELLVRFHLPASVSSRPSSSLSGGQRQVLNLLSLLARPQSPAVVFVDEPFNNLDLANLGKCLYIIKRLRIQGTAVVLVNHLPNLDLPIDSSYDVGETVGRLSNGINEASEEGPRKLPSQP